MAWTTRRGIAQGYEDKRGKLWRPDEDEEAARRDWYREQLSGPLTSGSPFKNQEDSLVGGTDSPFYRGENAAQQSESALRERLNSTGPKMQQPGSDPMKIMGSDILDRLKRRLLGEEEE